MIFIGDIAVPDGITPHIERLSEIFGENTTIANLEGRIVCS